MERVGILGGTFNPVHNGHLRHAIEAAEALDLEQVLLTPCKIPPHKAASGILPFATRAGYIQQAIEGEKLLGINLLEGEMEGPSYTYISLGEWSARNKNVKPYFLLGLEDFASLRTWYRGLDLWEKAHLVVASRGGGAERFRRICVEYWPKQKIGAIKSALGQRLPSLTFGSGTSIIFINMPRLEISSTRVRSLALNRQSIRGLVPDALINAYTSHEVLDIWRLGK